MRPGHPLLDSVIDLSLERYRNLLSQGAVLIDENDAGAEPRVLVYLEHSIQDGRVAGNGRPRVISQKLQFVFLDRHGKAIDGGAAPYLDCRPASEQEQELVESGPAGGLAHGLHRRPGPRLRDLRSGAAPSRRGEGPPPG